MDNLNQQSDDMENEDQATGNDGQKVLQEERSRKQRELQREIVMLESDYRKKLNEKNLIDSEIRKFKKQDAKIKVEIQACMEKMKRMDQDIMLMENDIRATKKKMSLV